MSSDEEVDMSEEVESSDDEEIIENDEEMEQDNEEDSTFKKPEVPVKKSVYLPGKPVKPGEELVYDPSAYFMLHSATTTSPCLSFDIIPDELGDNRDLYPHTLYLVGGTQAEKAKDNSIIIMKASNLVKTMEDDDDESESESSESDDEDSSQKEPVMNRVTIRHQGCINRIRCRRLNDMLLTAAWSEQGKVSIFDLEAQLRGVDDKTNAVKRSKKGLINKKGLGEIVNPLYVFTGHQSEGYGLDWSTMEPGVLATGDCKKNIHIWRPHQSSWSVSSVPLVGHSSSVEDLQWSPNEKFVLASCSVDKSIRIWDTREIGTKACKLSVTNAHQSDINVISWNKKEPLILSGGDDGFLHVWDLRNFQSGKTVATLKHHSDAVTTVEWHPTESSIFASGGADDQISLWDLAVERDDGDKELPDLPPQLLFIHQGQADIKELHWHPQIPGMVISTANSGFNFFKTISV